MPAADEQPRPAGQQPGSAPEQSGTAPAKPSWLERLGFAAKPAQPAEAKRTPSPSNGPAAATRPAAPVVESASPAAKVANPEPAGAPADGAPALTASSPTATQNAAAPAEGPSTVVLPAVAAQPLRPGPDRSSATRPKPGTPRRTRKARLRLSRLDPWSVMKTSFLFSIAAGIMLVVAVYMVWTVLEASNLFDSMNEIVASVISTPGDTTPFRVQEYLSTQKVMGVAALLACIDVVIFTALATLGSFLYNLAATMLGGLEVTLAED